MSDTTRNPDDAVERGTVAIGDQRGAPRSQANRAAAAEPAAGAAGNGAGTGAGGPAGTDTGATGGAHAAAGDGPATGSADRAPADAASPVAQNGAADASAPEGQAADDGSAAPAGPSPSGSARSGPGASGPAWSGRAASGPVPPRTRGAARDAPSARPPQATPPRGADQVKPPTPAGPAQFTPPPAEPSVPGSAGRPVPAPRPGGQESAGDRAADPPVTGPVPGPGPGAAPPPPWRRMPDAQRAERPRPDATGLLDEGPTAFMETPRDVAGTSSPSSARGGESGWSMRAMRTRPPRQAALQLRRLDPWSVLKLALVLAVVLFFIWLVAVGILYGVLDGMGVWDRLNGTYADLVSGQASGSPLISAGRVFAVAAIVGAINSLLFAVAVTLAAFIYNVSADLVGGVEVTLSERD